MSFWDKLRDAKAAAEEKFKSAKAQAEENQRRHDAEDEQRLLDQDAELGRLEKRLALRKRVQDKEKRVKEIEATTTLKGRIMRGIENRLAEAVAPKKTVKKA